MIITRNPTGNITTIKITSEETTNTKPGPNSDGTYSFYVTSETHDDLDSIYYDLETPGVMPNNISALSRAVECEQRLEDSRTTLYNLTHEEANLLKTDPRIKNVELHPKYLDVVTKPCASQSSSYWDKSNSISSSMKNWGLLRSTLGQNITGWGRNSYYGYVDPNYTSTSQSATINLPQTGKNVDIIVVDDMDVIPDHPEFFSNADGTGTNRFLYYNWYQHNPTITGGAAGTYPQNGQYPGLSDSTNFHPTHVMGTAGGNTQGWAKDANLYHLYFNVSNWPLYVREFHKNKPINPATGRKNPTIINCSFYSTDNSPLGNGWYSVTELQWNGQVYTNRTYDGPPPGFTFNVNRPSGVGLGSGIFPAYPDNSSLNLLQETAYLSLSYSSTVSGPNLLGTTGFQNLGAITVTTPTVGNNDNGYFTINLPFNVSWGFSNINSGSYAAYTYNQIFVGTNGYITFIQGYTNKDNLYLNDLPPYWSRSIPDPGIYLFPGDRSVQRLFYVTTGTSPNRIFKLRIEGSHTSTGTVGSSTVEVELQFYETPTSLNTSPTLRIDWGNNSSLSTSPGTYNRGWTLADLISLGVDTNKIYFTPYRADWYVSQLEDLIANGVIVVAAAANDTLIHHKSTNVGYNNYIKSDGYYQNPYTYPPGTYPPGTPYYMWRGHMPGVNETKATGGSYNVPVVVVGAIDGVIDKLAPFSNRGSFVELYAPGTFVMSSFSNYTGATLVIDSRSTASHKLAKISGTSMACPQVAGVLACALEVYPEMTQSEARDYIVGLAKNNQINYSVSESAIINAGVAGEAVLKGSPNKFLYYRVERNSAGNVFPKINYKTRPDSGRTWPRVRVKSVAKSQNQNITP